MRRRRRAQIAVASIDFGIRRFPCDVRMIDARDARMRCAPAGVIRIGRVGETVTRPERYQQQQVMA